MNKFIKKSILSLTLLLVLVGCSNKNIDNNNSDIDIDKLTGYELVKYAASITDIPNLDSVRENLIIPKAQEFGTKVVNIDWETNDRNIINSFGVVTRPESGGDVNMILTGTFSYLESKTTKEYPLKVIQIPETDSGKIDEAEDRLYIFENNYVNVDELVLPRVAPFATSVTWTSSDESILSNDGYVNRTSDEQKVNLKAHLSLGSETREKDFTLTISSTNYDRPELITENDSRIKSKVYVSSKSELLDAINDSEAGDAIILENGEYNNIEITSASSGTKNNPIFIIAKNPGFVEFTGSTLLKFTGNWNVLSGLSFVNGYPALDTGVIQFKGESNRLTNSMIQGFERDGDDYKWVSLTGKYHEVDRNLFHNKTVGGSLLTIWRDDNLPQYMKIFKNHFKDFSDAGGANGYETIRIGTSQQSQSDAFVTIEDNLFENLDGEIEIISVKSGRNIIKNNTIIESKGLFTARHGTNNLFESNLFIGNGKAETGGIRLYDGGHIVRNNYIDGITTGSNTRAGIVLHSGVNMPGLTTTMNAQWTPFNILVENNTILNSKQPILFGGKYKFAATNITFKNNVVNATTGYGIRADIKPDVNNQYLNNFIYGIDGLIEGQIWDSTPNGISETLLDADNKYQKCGISLSSFLDGGSNINSCLEQSDVGKNW